ncbi:hypothetical protein AGDE_13737 [Angomonas deanei]|uniref:Phenazine biosynthesis-like protein, putative n=1 Tax=Angomonas deanei TaxID=59799 RepID=A0A7G2CTF5_9TRYP|nr:hypothetical protein AGDE_13737 [Angomonas deanei]CAD2221723.1 Phenazine biosynthesis-like protein, putative [Angomonas deanei]|eukprot:EPY21801.1 hypothetical protein AGDE_13737 [Angomonas deanei]
MHFPFNKPDVITGLLPPSVLRDLEKALHVEEGTVLDIACNRHLRYYAARLKSGAAVEHCVAEETTLRQVFLSEAYLTAQKQHPDLIHPISALGVIAEDDDTERSDVISRFFAPWLGVLEDPVTGSWCTVFVPNWLQAHDRLTVGSQLRSYQAS